MNPSHKWGRSTEGGEAPGRHPNVLNPHVGGPDANGATTAGAPATRGLRRGVAVNTGLYLREEQRRPPGCIAGRMPAPFMR